ncbi:MAG TPA: transposase, partial [Firmicutes bacterium]|nr:transposase [Bacillota bacterium]
PWADKLRLEDLKLISSEGVDDEFKKKSGDIVYEATIDGQDIIFIIMLEFQSSVDYSMPVRLLQYMLIQLNRYMADHYRQPNVKDLKLPIIFPIVLYNGKEKWNAALELKDLYENADLYGNGILNFKYDILDVNNNYSKQELIDNPNLTSVLFLFDQ